MTEFEHKILSMLNNVDTKLSSMDEKISKMDARISKIEDDISNIKEDLEITRVAANYNGEKLEELAIDLKKMNVIS